MRVTILVYTGTASTGSPPGASPTTCPRTTGNWSVLIIIRPSSNKKLFPVHRPGGLKRAYCNFFFLIFNFCFYFSPLYILVYKK